jgi:ubiquinone/menaquinone biosynthesis C-methylase UbiE
MKLSKAEIYDLIYGYKDYEAESNTLMKILAAHNRSGGNELLDVACGTGEHIIHLKEHYQIEGLDLSEDQLAVARRKNPEIPFHELDMTDFNLGRQFDAVVCLFSAIGYAKTPETCQSAINCMTRHLKPGGVLAIEPWFTPEEWVPNTPHLIEFESDELKIARVNTSFVDGRISWFDLHYLVGTSEGTEHFVSHHELGLFSMDEMREMLTNAGLVVTYDEEGLTGRGLWIGEVSL